MSPAKPRQYSRAFTPKPGAARRQLSIDNVPPALHREIKAKAKRDGVSVRALVLSYLERWTAEPSEPAR